MRHHLLALAALLLLAVPPAESATLERTRVMSDGRGYLFSFRFDGAVAPRHFTLERPHRLVIDLDDAAKGRGIADLPLAGALVRGIRYGLRDGNGLRIVVDLEAPVTYALGSLKGEPEVVRLTLTRNPAGRFERRDLPAVAPPPEERAATPAPEERPAPPAEQALPATAPHELKCLRLVDGPHDCAALIDEMATITDNPYPNDAPPPPAATFEVDRPEPKGEPQGSLGIHRFLKRSRDGKRRADIGYKTYVGESEVGVSLLRPSLTWEREAGGGDLRFLLRPDELQLGYQKQWQ